MLLAIDAGNTDIVFALHDKKKWVHHWRIPTHDDASRNQWQYRLVSELLELGLKADVIKRGVVSCVVPALAPMLHNMLKALLGKPPIIVGPAVYKKLEVKVQNTAEIGTDLVANIVAAYERYHTACVVVDFGTALTFTTVSGKGKIEGVAIAPGLKTALHSLFENTAQLPEVPLEVPHSALGKNTVQAIQAGVVLGYVGLVKHLLGHIKKELATPCKCIATGGLSKILTPLQESFDEIDPLLTLEGLRIIEQQCEHQ